MSGVRLIDANALEKDMRAYAERKYANGHIETGCGILSAICRIEEAPTIDAEPVVHAHWKVRRGIPFCSNCLEIINGYSCDHDISTTPRCSFCGAKMDGGAEGV